MKQAITFDQVFNLWMDAEVHPLPGRNLLAMAKKKGFNSITEWRLATAVKLGLPKKKWILTTITNPNITAPKIIIGPFAGWSRFFSNQLSTSFGSALKITEFFEWCKKHDRISKLGKHLPLPTTVILLQKPNGKYICIEGGHRICAISYAKQIGKPLKFTKTKKLTAAIAKITNAELSQLKKLIQASQIKKLSTKKVLKSKTAK